MSEHTCRQRFAPHPRVKVSFPPDEPHSRSVTKQSFRDDVEINTIVGRWITTGVNPHESPVKPRWGDFIDGLDYQDALFRVKDAQRNFEAMPSHLRNRFENDPAKLLAFLADNGNQREAYELGLVESPENRLPPVSDAGDSTTPSPSQPAGNQGNPAPAVGTDTPQTELSEAPNP